MPATAPRWGWYIGDITEAFAISAVAGDPLGLPQHTPGAHSINDDRITAFMRGYLGGVDGCGFPASGEVARSWEPTRPTIPVSQN